MTKHVFVALAAVIALAGCKEVKVQNGEVPDQYRAQAEAYMGTYRGQFEGVAGAVTFSMNGRKVMTTSTVDFAGHGCQSSVGELKSIDVSKSGSTYVLDSATFEFDANRCPFTLGKTITFSFKNTSSGLRADASLLISSHMEERCWMLPDAQAIPGPVPPIPPGRERCRMESIDDYAYGTFRK